LEETVFKQQKTARRNNWKMIKKRGV